MINNVQKGKVVGFDLERIKKYITQLLEFGEIAPVKGELIEGKVCENGHPLLKFNECIESTIEDRSCNHCQEEYSRSNSVYYSCGKQDDECAYDCCANCLDKAANSSKYNLI